MTTYELIQQLSKYPPHTRVAIAYDWGDPVVDDSYLEIEGDPSVALHSAKDEE